MQYFRCPFWPCGGNGAVAFYNIYAFAKPV